GLTLDTQRTTRPVMLAASQKSTVNVVQRVNGSSINNRRTSKRSGIIALFRVGFVLPKACRSSFCQNSARVRFAKTVPEFVLAKRCQSSFCQNAARVRFAKTLPGFVLPKRCQSSFCQNAARVRFAKTLPEFV